MGSDGPESRDPERPVHTAQVSAFELARYPVTNALYAIYVREARATPPKRWIGGRIPLGLERHPVVSVSWEDATAFCAWLAARTTQPVRLPTEAEWEYACRAGTTGERYGEINLIAWYGENSNDQTHPVGEKMPNARDLHDMLGNVWEWCGDWWGSYAATDQVDPAGPSSGSGRVLRGGSWFSYARHVRAALRNLSSPDYRGADFGFRLARGQVRSSK